MSFEQQSAAGLLATASFGQCFGRVPYQIRAALMGVFLGLREEGAGLSIQFSFSSLVIHSLQGFRLGFLRLSGLLPPWAFLSEVFECYLKPESYNFFVVLEELRHFPFCFLQWG